MDQLGYSPQATGTLLGGFACLSKGKSLVDLHSNRDPGSAVAHSNRGVSKEDPLHAVRENNILMLC